MSLKAQKPERLRRKRAPNQLIRALLCSDFLTTHIFDTRNEEAGSSGFFDMLEQYPHIGQTKDASCACHRANEIPADRIYYTAWSNPSAASVNGLNWFDSIADKLVSDVRIGNEDHVVHVYGNQIIAEALDVLWKNRTGAVAVLETESTRLIGSITNSNIYLVVENDNVFRSINTLTVGEFIHTEPNKTGSEPCMERDVGAVSSAGFLHLKNDFSPRMDSQVTHKRSHTLKQVMSNK